MTAELRYPSGHTGRVECSMWSSSVLKISAKVIGSRGSLSVLNPLMPQAYHRLSVRVGASRRTEKFPRRARTSTSWTRSRRQSCEGEPVKTSAADAVETMTVIDEIYRAAGLPVREPS